MNFELSDFANVRTMEFELEDFANVRTMEFELEDFANVRTMEFELEDFANVRTMEFELQDFANNTDTFSANLTIDFGSWTESGGTYTFSDNDPGSSTSLNFNNKTLSEVIDLIEDVSGLTARLVSNPDNPSLTVQIRSEETGFQKGFRISGSGAATDERWTTPSIPTDHTYSNDFTQLAEDFHGSGVLHGPAMVSDEFEAQKGDILKLRYKAEGDDDWYHVASYIVRLKR